MARHLIAHRDRRVHDLAEEQDAAKVARLELEAANFHRLAPAGDGHFLAIGVGDDLVGLLALLHLARGTLAIVGLATTLLGLALFAVAHDQ